MSNVNLSQRFNSRGMCIVDRKSWSIEILNLSKEQISFQSLTKGKEFMRQIRKHYLIDDNCKIISIMIDGYKSDIGLSYKGINQGGIRLDKYQFKKLCKLHKVVVLWNSIEEVIREQD